MSTYYGEILKGYPPSSPKNRYKDRYEYDVLVSFSQGQQVITNVRVAGEFDGPDDFTETVLRGSQDDGGKGGYFNQTPTDANQQAGTRVIIVFPGDTGKPNLYSGFIVGTIGHPKNTVLLNTSKSPLLPNITQENAPPQYRRKFNGVFSSVDSAGQYRLQYNGLAVIKPNNSNLSTPPTIDKYGQMTMDFLQKSVFRLVDNNSQALVIDSFGKYVSLNNSTSPNSATATVNEVLGVEPPKAQEVRLDKNSNTLWLRSAGLLNIVSKEQLSKNEKITVDTKEFNLLDNSGSTLSIKGGSIQAKANSIKLEDNSASLQIEGGKVSLGTSSAEVVDLAIQHIDALINSNPLGISVTGPVLISPALAATLTSIKSLLTSIKK